jgi:hypothetical protein
MTTLVQCDIESHMFSHTATIFPIALTQGPGIGAWSPCS